MAILMRIASRLLFVTPRKVFVGPFRFEDLDGDEIIEWSRVTPEAFGAKCLVEFGFDRVLIPIIGFSRAGPLAERDFSITSQPLSLQIEELLPLGVFVARFRFLGIVSFHPETPIP
jgi:hypothetical protein